MLNFKDYEEHFNKLSIDEHDAKMLLVYMESLIEVVRTHLDETNQQKCYIYEKEVYNLDTSIHKASRR